MSLSPGYGYIRYFKKVGFREIIALLDNPGFERIDADEIARLSVKAFVMGSVKVLLEDKRFAFVKNAPVDSHPELGYRWLSAGVGWDIFDSDDNQVASVPFEEGLPPELALLPIEIFLPADTIVKRLRSRWVGEDDTGDLAGWFRKEFPDAGKVKAETSFTSISMFIECPKRSAKAIHKALLQGGFDAKREPYAEEKAELSVTRAFRNDESSFDQINELEAGIGKIIKPLGGEITGNEIF